jgi:hypothetical protein
LVSLQRLPTKRRAAKVIGFHPRNITGIQRLAINPVHTVAVHFYNPLHLSNHRWLLTFDPIRKRWS